MIELRFNIKPKPAPRPRFRNDNGHAYLPAEYQQYIAELRRQLQFQFPAYCLADNISLTVTFFKNRPINCHNFGDLDNLLKAIMDAMNGIVYQDDAQVVTITASKIRSKEEFIHIIIRCLEDNNGHD